SRLKSLLQVMLQAKARAYTSFVCRAAGAAVRSLVRPHGAQRGTNGGNARGNHGHHSIAVRRAVGAVAARTTAALVRAAAVGARLVAGVAMATRTLDRLHPDRRGVGDGSGRHGHGCALAAFAGRPRPDR